MNKQVKTEETQAPVPLPEMTKDDVIQTLEDMCNHFKSSRDKYEQEAISARAEANRHATARVKAETELQSLKQQLQEKPQTAKEK